MRPRRHEGTKKTLYKTFFFVSSCLRGERCSSYLDGRASLDEPQEVDDALPDPRQAGNQLMVVVDERQGDVGPLAREGFDRPVVDRRVAQSLEDERRLRERRGEGIV